MVTLTARGRTSIVGNGAISAALINRWSQKRVDAHTCGKSPKVKVEFDSPYERR